MILLDSGVLSAICRADGQTVDLSLARWLKDLRSRSVPVGIPAIADYEVRRGFLKQEWLRALAVLDELAAEFDYFELEQPVLRRAAELWALTRRRGNITARDEALDGDVILAAQAQLLEEIGEPVAVATTNIRHLSWFVDARRWEDIDPEHPFLRA